MLLLLLLELGLVLELVLVLVLPALQKLMAARSSPIWGCPLWTMTTWK